MITDPELRTVARRPEKLSRMWKANRGPTLLPERPRELPNHAHEYGSAKNSGKRREPMSLSCDTQFILQSKTRWSPSASGQGFVGPTAASARSKRPARAVKGESRGAGCFGRLRPPLGRRVRDKEIQMKVTLPRGVRAGAAAEDEDFKPRAPARSEAELSFKRARSRPPSPGAAASLYISSDTPC